MALSKEAYQALEAIVGPDNISDDPAILDPYSFYFSHGGENVLVRQIEDGDSYFTHRFEAALLPGSTEEVQAIVKTCNRYKVKIRPTSTFWTTRWSAPQTTGVIQLDLRRMNRILEIDEKNMFAVVEPYVIAAQLQAEAMKVGLNCNMIGAGGSCSPLAQSTSGGGHGPHSIYHGHASEVMLAFEWVMPNGEILRSGSLGADCGWFCGEGPGPSLRGTVRGRGGARGGMGVFTKCAIKLSPWPGPAELAIEGTAPAYVSPLPENVEAYTLGFPNWQSYADAIYQIWDGEIGYMGHRQFNVLGGDLQFAFLKMYTDPTKTLSDIEEILKQPEVQKTTEEMRYAFQLVLVGNSRRDFEYQEKVLDQILANVGGWKVAGMSEPVMKNFTFLYLMRMGRKNINHVYAGSACHSVTEMGSPDTLIKQTELQIKMLAKYQERGLLVKMGGDGMMGCIGPMGGGTYTLLEQFCAVDPANVGSLRESVEYQIAMKKAARKEGFIIGPFKDELERSSQELEAEPGDQSESALFSLHTQWMIKQALDPNNTGAPGYATKKPPGEKK